MSLTRIGPAAPVGLKTPETIAEKQSAKSDIREVLQKIFSETQNLSRDEEAELLSSFSQKEKAPFIASWWECWANFIDPKNTIIDFSRDFLRPPPADELLRNAKLFNKWVTMVLKGLPKFTTQEVKDMVSFLDVMTQFSPSLEKAMGRIRQIASCTDKTSTRAGREIHRFLNDRRSQIVEEMPTDALKMSGWKGEVPEALALRIGVNTASF